MAKFFIFMENSESFQNHSFSNKKRSYFKKQSFSLFYLWKIIKAELLKTMK